MVAPMVSGAIALFQEAAIDLLLDTSYPLKNRRFNNNQILTKFMMVTMKTSLILLLKVLMNITTGLILKM